MSNIPWIEKYRPINIEHIIADANIITELNNIIKNKNIPNLIFTGTPGVGKTTSILCIARQLYGQYMKDAVLELNASDDRGIKSINQDVSNFCSYRLPYSTADEKKYSKHKLIIFDEADNMTEKALAIISQLMDTFYNTTRFVFTCNSSSKIIESIQSRCKIIRYIRLEPIMIASRLEDICKIENIKYDKNSLLKLSEISNGDMRSAINILQLAFNKFNSVNEKAISEICELPSNVVISKILVDATSNKIKNALDKVYKLRNNGYSVSDILNSVFITLKATTFTLFDENLKFQIIYVLSSYLYMISKNTDSDLQLTAFILEISKINKKSILI
jgi:replication factor C subunit 2/4